ncbi:MAG: protein phosphatase 2C domain-containing protein [Succinivibrionaceae bacterium]
MIVQIKSLDGSIVEFEDSKIIGKGEMKDVYFSPDHSYVVAFYRNSELDQKKLLDRLETITGKYRHSIFNNKGGSYWEPLYCWPTKVVIYQGKVGLVSPTYRNCFFFKYGSLDNDSGGIRGKEKEGKWFSSIRNQHFLDPRERGNWRGYVIACFKVAQAVKRLNAAGLAHSDLSYKNVLIDPPTGQISIIDLDGLVVTGKFNPEVMGTSDFIAPEVMATQNLKLSDPQRVLPSIETDCHALATLIYMYLLNRHPLRGGKVYSLDPDEDEELVMGENALFIENPADDSNRVNVNDLYPLERQCGDPRETPYTLCGNYLKILFDRAFIDGLHNPKLRPRSEEWANALANTIELLVPCSNMMCKHGWLVYERGVKECPFCHEKIPTELPVFYFYRRIDGDFHITNTKLVGYNGKDLTRWHLRAERTPVEFNSAYDNEIAASIRFENGVWYIHNIHEEFMQDALYNRNISLGSSFMLTNNCQLRFSNNPDELVMVRFDNVNEPPTTIRPVGEKQSYMHLRSDSYKSRLNAAVSQLKKEHPEFFKKFQFLFDQDEIIFPDGIINREYSFAIQKIFPEDCRLHFIGLNACGLYFNRAGGTIRGFPNQVGDINVLITVKIPYGNIKVTKNARLKIDVPNHGDLKIDNTSDKNGMTCLPQAFLNQTYLANFNDIFKDIEIENILGHESLGLVYNSHTKILSGVPAEKGDFILKVRYRSKGLGGSKLLLLSKSVVLSVHDAVQITWNDIPTPTNIRFYKPDICKFASEVYVNESQTSIKRVYAVCTRGRVHANNGLPRNTDFALGDQNGWVMLAYADGSDKAEFSREGSKVAVASAVKSFKSNIEKIGSELDEFVHILALPPKDLNVSDKDTTIQKGLLTRVVYEAFRSVFNEISIQATFGNVSFESMDTTLSLVILKRYDFGWFVMSASVGKCGIMICNGDYDMIPMGFTEYGDYMFRAGTVMDQHYISYDEIKLRIDYKITDSLLMLVLMNHALFKEIFPNYMSMRSHDSWTNWIADLATNVELKARDQNLILDALYNYISTKMPQCRREDKSIIIVK